MYIQELQQNVCPGTIVKCMFTKYRKMYVQELYSTMYVHELYKNVQFLKIYFEKLIYLLNSES